MKYLPEKDCIIVDVSADYILTGFDYKNRERNCVAEKIMKLSNKEFEIVSDLIGYMEDKK